MTLRELSLQIHSLVSQKQYNEALALFKATKGGIAAESIAQNEYLAADMLTALRGVKAIGAAYEFLRIYNIVPGTETSNRMLNSYGWLLYATLKSETNTSESSQTDIKSNFQIQNRLKIFLEIMQLPAEADEKTFRDHKYSISLIEFLFRIIIKQEKSKINPDWKFLSDICERINPIYLSEQCHTINVEQKNKTKELELASAREEWYAAYSKGLMETNRYSKCQEICSEALRLPGKLHYDNKIWFERRIAQCYSKTNKPAEAIKIYSEIIRQKHDWFLYKELSECYFKEGNLAEAIRYGKQAASAFGPINFKVELIELMGDILSKQGNDDLAHIHYLLVIKIREAEKWNINQNLKDKITRVSTSNDIPDRYSKEKLKEQLFAFWNNNTERTNNPNQIKNTSKGKGTIFKLLPPKAQGRDGFIKSENGKTFYFFLQTGHENFEQLKCNQSVEFEIIDTPKGEKAVKIKFIN